MLSASAEFVDLLRGGQDQLGVLDAFLDPLRRLGQEVVELGVEDGDSGMGLEEGDPVFPVLDDRAVDLQTELPPGRVRGHIREVRAYRRDCAGATPQ